MTMANAMVSAVFSMVGKAPSPLTNHLLKEWAASVELGSNVKALERELKSVKAMFEHTIGGEIENSSLKELLEDLQDLGACCNTITHAVGKCFPCSPVPSVSDDDDDDSDNDNDDNIMHNYSPERNRTNEPPKLRFGRVVASKRMKHIIEQLRLVRGNVSSIITTIGSNWTTVRNIAQSRPITTSESIEPKLYRRDYIMNLIIPDIILGKNCGEVLKVIPIVGPGGIGKTTLAQHIYHSGEVQKHFDVKVWTCVSLNFNASKLIEKIEKYITKVDGEESNVTAGELIRQRLKCKRFLLVLDDVWDCGNKDEWKRLLLIFKQSEVHGLDHKEFKELFLHFIFGDDQSRKYHRLLLKVGDEILCRLKGYPLAGKTVGRLLKKQIDLGHCTRVLATPAMFNFYYCALFPQDYKFEREELINFWIGLDVLHSSLGENKRVGYVGRSHLKQLVNHGFFEKEMEKDVRSCNIIHDLLHKLARKVSSHEFLSIDSSQSQVLSYLHVLPSIRHLSINIDNTNFKDRLALKNCMEDFNTLNRRLNVEKLRSLMLFGGHHGCVVKAFGDLFREAKALRVIFLSKASYHVEELLCNFYNLVHLHHLRIQNSPLVRTRFPDKLSKFYHMMVLDAKYCDDIIDLPRDMSNLVKSFPCSK
ncbi:hypothetical protein BAE44_0011458 [Dichanthelium oligosanthes]|uniref:Uncharacterized protein n=1 Tax=Dichanthelium oligosanthes TaxID=888268 RepID=A0A1E5VQY3_9POAL|nr:hypothetical protein BAE44_0011458 [Dichanthelium oligosanthes]